MNNLPALVIEGDETLRRSMKDYLHHSGFEVVAASRSTSVLEFLQARHFALAIIGSPCDGDELDVAERVRHYYRNLPLILLSDNDSQVHTIAALRVGVNDYLKLPVSFAELGASIQRCLSFESSKLSPGAVNRSPDLIDHGGMIGTSQAIREIREYLPRVAETDSTVLITGETGTGKELVAELIHQYSPRHEKRLTSINCAAVPDGLLESELFGHEKGAFTGACSAYRGKLRPAEGGTVFFDEIGDMSPCAQAKMLRVIETKEIYPVGGENRVSLDIRVIAATNQDLDHLMREGKFRQDLYFRLNVVKIDLPPLRERKEDIPLLLDHFLGELNCRLNGSIEGVADKSLELLLRHHWPGNVRELKSLLEEIFISLRSGRISVPDLPSSFQQQREKESGPSERETLLATLCSTNWNKSKAAEKLHWSRMTLYRKMAKYEIASSRQR